MLAGGCGCGWVRRRKRAWLGERLGRIEWVDEQVVGE